MAIIPVDINSVAVQTYSDLNTVLANTGSAYTQINTVYLASDIVMSGGISISTSRPSITIDGKDPFDTSGNTIHTVTDYDSIGSSDTIGVRVSNSNISVIYQNLIWKGKNYYGIFYTPDSSNYQNVSVKFINVQYDGCQMVYNRSGITRFIDCKVNIIKTTTRCNAEEVGEISKVEIGGTCVFTHIDSSDTLSMFWFVYGPHYFNILPNADVTFTTNRDVFRHEAAIGYLPITIGKNASFKITTDRGVFLGSGHRAASMLVDEDATFRVIRNAMNTGVATFYCNGEFRVKKNAIVYMQANYSGGASLLYFPSSSSSLYLDDPRDFALYKASGNSIYFSTTTNIYMYAQQFNYWAAAMTPLESAGLIYDLPLYSWRKINGDHATIQGTSTGTAVNLSSDFSTEELEDKPLTNLRLYSAPVFSAGNLPLTVNRITPATLVVSGTTTPSAIIVATYSAYTQSGFADTEGIFAVITGEIPLGYEVIVKANIPFLITTMIKFSEEPGTLDLLYVPDEMFFLLRNIVAEEPVKLYGRDDSNWYMTVSDSRDYDAPWYLYAYIDNPLTSVINSEHTVPGALVYISEDNTVVELSELPVLVYTGEGNGGVEKETEVSWDETKGILIQSVPYPYFNGEEYRAPIQWVLSETEL